MDLALAALAVIKEREDVRLRPALLRKYTALDADGVRRDPGGVVRTATLKALRPVALPEDVVLAERAVATYEFLYGEAAGDLRGAGLLLLNEVDPPLAGFHSVRLLDDQYTSIMSGEPAVTAARVLAAQGQVLPLYAYVMRDEPAVADVVGEGLRSLGAMPPSLLPAVVKKYRTSKSEIVLLGLFDLLLASDARPAYLPFIFDFLQSTTLYNLYRYLLIVLVTGHDPDIMEQIEAMARRERDPTKREIWREARTLA